VALPLQQHLLPGHRHYAGLNHALHGVVVRRLASTTGRIGDHVDLISGIVDGGQGEGQVADLGPQAGNDDLVAAVLLQRVTNLLVVPGVHRGTLQRRRIREYGKQLGVGMAGEAFGLDRGDDGRNVEDLGSLVQTHGVVLQGLPVDALDAESHLRLLVDEDQLAVLRGQDFGFWIAHGAFLWVGNLRGRPSPSRQSRPRGRGSGLSQLDSGGDWIAFLLWYQATLIAPDDWGAGCSSSAAR